MEDNPCCQSIIQTSLLIFNVITFIVSGAIFGFSVYTLVDGGINRSVLPDGLPDVVADFMFDDSGNSLKTPVIILVCVSTLVLLVSFLGCIGTWRQSRCLVALYTIALMIFLALLFGGTCWVFLGDAEGAVGSGLRQSMSGYENDNGTRLMWDRLQDHLSCCGVYSNNDWKTVLTNSTCLAPSSCKNVPTKDTSEPDMMDCLTSLDDTFTRGCLPALKESLTKYKHIVGGIMMTVWVVVIINVLFSFALCVVLDYAEYTYK